MQGVDILEYVRRVQELGNTRGLFCPSCGNEWYSEVLRSTDGSLPHWCAACKRLLFPLLTYDQDGKVLLQ